MNPGIERRVIEVYFWFKLSWLGVLSDQRVVGSGFVVLLAEVRRAEEEGRARDAFTFR